MTATGRRSDGPITWVLLGQRAGDNAQAMAVAQAVSDAAGGQIAPKPLAYNRLYRVPNLVLGASLRSLRPERRSAIVPPWPDVVIGVGRRSVPVARWIKARSAGASKLVQIGRPRAPLNWFDLVITTPQYRLPEAPNILHLLLPAISVPTLEPAERERWGSVFAALPRPWIGVLVGGARPPYRFDTPAGHALALRASGFAERLGGSLLVTTSPRTGAAQALALAKAITRPAHCNLWQPGADNAHHAILALADRFIVTGDSVSMLAEACQTGRPVAIYELPRHGLYMAWSGERGVGRLLARCGLVSPPRDPQAVVRRLVEKGHAMRLDAPEPASFIPAPDERARVLAAIRTVVDAARARGRK